MDHGFAPGTGKHLAVRIDGIAIGADGEGVPAGGEKRADRLEDIGLGEVSGGAPGLRRRHQAGIDAGGVGDVVRVGVVLELLVGERVGLVEVLVQGGEADRRLERSCPAARILRQAAVDEVGEGEEGTPGFHFGHHGLGQRPNLIVVQDTAAAPSIARIRGVARFPSGRGLVQQAREGGLSGAIPRGRQHGGPGSHRGRIHVEAAVDAEVESGPVKVGQVGERFLLARRGKEHPVTRVRQRALVRCTQGLAPSRRTAGGEEEVVPQRVVHLERQVIDQGLGLRQAADGPAGVEGPLAVALAAAGAAVVGVADQLLVPAVVFLFRIVPRRRGAAVGAVLEPRIGERIADDEGRMPDEGRKLGMAELGERNRFDPLARDLEDHPRAGALDRAAECISRLDARAGHRHQIVPRHALVEEIPRVGAEKVRRDIGDVLVGTAQRVGGARVPIRQRGDVEMPGPLQAAGTGEVRRVLVEPAQPEPIARAGVRRWQAPAAAQVGDRCGIRAVPGYRQLLVVPVLERAGDKRKLWQRGEGGG